MMPNPIRMPKTPNPSPHWMNRTPSRAMCLPFAALCVKAAPPFSGQRDPSRAERRRGSRSVAASRLRLLHVGQDPLFLEELLPRRVEASHQLGLALRIGRQPVAFLAGRRLRPEEDVHGAVGVLLELGDLRRAALAWVDGYPPPAVIC